MFPNKYFWLNKFSDYFWLTQACISRLLSLLRLRSGQKYELMVLTAMKPESISCYGPGKFTESTVFGLLHNCSLTEILSWCDV